MRCYAIKTYQETKLVPYPSQNSDSLLDAASDKVYFAQTNTHLSALSNELEDFDSGSKELAQKLPMGYTDLSVFKRVFSISDDGSTSFSSDDYMAFFLVFERQKRHFLIYLKYCSKELESLAYAYYLSKGEDDVLKHSFLKLLQEIKEEVRADRLTLIAFSMIDQYFWH